jgi:hypothetical protein
MTQLLIPTVWYVEGHLMVDASTLSGLVREVAREVVGWEVQGADLPTLHAVDHMLRNLADRIDVDCIALLSSAVEGSGRRRPDDT